MDKQDKRKNQLQQIANKDTFFDKQGSSLLMNTIVICYYQI